MSWSCGLLSAAVSGGGSVGGGCGPTGQGGGPVGQGGGRTGQGGDHSLRSGVGLVAFWQQLLVVEAV